MRLVISLLLAARVASQVFVTDFQTHPNMVCQMYNAWAENSHMPGFVEFQMRDYATGASVSQATGVTTPLRRDGSANWRANSMIRRLRTCGESYCKKLITYGEGAGGAGLTRDQALNDHNHPVSSIPRPIPGGIQAFPGDFGRGWDYETEIFQRDIRDIVQCDEYPYASTHEGGDDNHGSRVNCIPGPENGSHGALLSAFYQANGIPDGGQFFLAASNIPSTLVISQNPWRIHCPNFCWPIQAGMPYPAGILPNHIIQATPNIACLKN